MAPRRSRPLSLADVQHLNDEEFTHFLVEELRDGTPTARKIWSEMTDEQRLVMLKYMGGQAGVHYDKQ